MSLARPAGFGFRTLVLLVVANMIGAGVFTTSGFTLASLGDPRLVLLAWLVGGIIALCGAWSYGLLVRRYPGSGGEYAFLARFHPLAGFIAGWVSILAGFSGAIAFAAKGFETYLPGGLPSGVPALGLVALGALAHAFRRPLGARLQDGTVLLKLVFLGVFLALAAGSALTTPWQGGPLPAPPSGSPALAFAGALVWISLSYSGFNAAVYVAGEVAEPKRIPRALLLGTALTTGLYLMLNSAFVLAPPPALIAGQPDVAARAAHWIGGEPFETLIRAVIALALATSVLSMLMAGPRVLGRMAADGLLPRCFVLSGERVWPAVLLQAGLAALLIGFTSLQSLLGYLSLTLSLCAAAAVATLWTGEPSSRLRGRATLAPAVFVGATLLCAVLLVLREPAQALGTVATVAVGTLAHVLRRRRTA